MWSAFRLVEVWRFAEGTFFAPSSGLVPLFFSRSLRASAVGSRLKEAVAWAFGSDKA